MSKKQTYRCFFIFIFLVLFISCDDNYMLDSIGTTHGDVFIKAVQKGNAVQYAVVYYAYSTSPMKTVHGYYETNPNNAIALDTIDGRFTFANFPAENGYTGSVPLAGKYWFDVEYMDGSSQLVFDELTNKVLETPVVESVLHQSEIDKITIAWQKNILADKYKLLLVDKANTIVFESDLLPNTQTSLSISKTNKNWETTAIKESLDSLKLVLQAFMFEETKSLVDLQCMAVNENAWVIWKK